MPTCSRLLQFGSKARDHARGPGDDARGQALDSATVRAWLRERVTVNPSNLQGSSSVFYTE